MTVPDPDPAAAPPLAPTLAPSEIVLLRGADFAEAAKYGEPVLGGDAKVKRDDWMRAAWLAAVAAVAAAGQVRLTATTSKHLFGLLTSHGVQIERTADGGPWPANSLEARILAALRQPVALQPLFHALLEDDVSDPASFGLTLAQRGLFARGLLAFHERKVLKVFTAHDVVVPPSTVALAAATRPEPVQALLRTRGGLDEALWKEVRSALDAAIRQRTERDTDPD